MEKIKKLINNPYIRLAVYILCIAAGGVLIATPGTSLITICYIGGIALSAMGALKIARYIRQKQTDYQNTFDAVLGGILLTIALALFIHPRFLMSVIPFLIGVSIVIYGVSGLLSRRGTGSVFSKVMSVLTVIYGASLIFNPFKGATSIVSMIGFGLIAFGIIKLVTELPVLKKPKFAPKTDENGYTEVDFRDV